MIKSDFVSTNILGQSGSYSSFELSNLYDTYIGKQEELVQFTWSNLNSNNWATSELNITNLNSNYLNYLSDEWEIIISENSWLVGGNSYNNIYNVSVKDAYVNELITPEESIKTENKIGLMYVSDYGYAASPENWKITLLNYNCNEICSNWLYLGFYEWTITKRSDNSNTVFNIDNLGEVHSSEVTYDNCVRPVFYLNSDVEIYEGHAGTASDPYRIVL